MSWVFSCSFRFSVSARRARPSQSFLSNGEDNFGSLMFLSLMGPRYGRELGDVGGEDDGEVRDEDWFGSLDPHSMDRRRSNSGVGGGDEHGTLKFGE